LYQGYSKVMILHRMVIVEVLRSAFSTGRYLY
jgi:hypothetical protein